jgi:phosphoglycolate phosphatase-like HAD superfamily hydrolase
MNLYFNDLVSRHKIWVFDCDGVVLDSNKLKTEAFHDVAKPFGMEAAKGLIDYHLSNGGVSRFKKFEWFLQSIRGNDFSREEHQLLCNQYGDLVKRKLVDCPYTDGFILLLNRLNNLGIKPYIVSGGFQDELRDVFLQRGVADCFAAIYGSPRDKCTILDNMALDGLTISSGIFFGDAKADFEAASQFEMSFVFVRKYSESPAWVAPQNARTFQSINSFSEIES